MAYVTGHNVQQGIAAKKSSTETLKGSTRRKSTNIGPAYKKFRTVADLERFQPKARFRPDKVYWWTNNIKQEKEERERQENLSREGSRHVC